MEETIKMAHSTNYINPPKKVDIYEKLKKHITNNKGKIMSRHRKLPPKPIGVKNETYEELKKRARAEIERFKNTYNNHDVLDIINEILEMDVEDFYNEKLFWKD